MPNSIKFSTRVTVEKWNCLLGNFFNLMETLGHNDTKLHEAFGSLPDNQHIDMKAIQKACKSIGYEVLNLPELNYEKLTHLLKSLCLPMLVSLRLDMYEHVIGISPYKNPEGGDMQFRIIDGAHPKLQCTEYSLANLNSCCGPGISFTHTSSGIAFIPGKTRSRKIIQRLIDEHGDNLDKSGLTICLRAQKKGQIGHLNIFKSPEEYADLCRQLGIVYSYTPSIKQN